MMVDPDGDSSIESGLSPTPPQRKQTPSKQVSSPETKTSKLKGLIEQLKLDNSNYVRSRMQSREDDDSLENEFNPA
jgi:hypothetical protein